MHASLLLIALAAATATSPITLDEALATAAKANVDLKIAGTDRAIAGADEYGSYAGVLPRLDLSASFGGIYTAASTQNISTIKSITQNPDGSFAVNYELSLQEVPGYYLENYALGLALKVPLFDGMRNWATIARAKALLRAADKSYDEASLTVAFQVTQRFYDVVRAERSLKVLQEAVKRSEELVRRTDALYEAGRAPRSDTYAARVTLGNDRIAAEQQLSRVSDARVALAVALGRSADPDLGVIPPAALDTTTFQEPPPQESLVDLAKRKRPLLAADAQRIRAAQEDVTVAQAGYWPNVSASANYNRQGPYLAGPQGVYGDPTGQFVATFGVAVNWNLFEGRATSAAVERANLTEEKVRLQSEGNLLQVTSEIARATAGYRTLSASAVLAEENLKSAQESLRLARTRFEAGVATQVEIRDALLALTRAELTLLTTRIDAIIARADLNRAVGGAL
ncbi:MAG TPA: TolC family protein [Anaeromyxobacteraceae bacterium]|nr:TolC family protein [Anaeromyxobacteraceae bacterium]